MSPRAGSVLLRLALALLLIAVMAPFGVSAAETGDRLHVALAAVEVAAALPLVALMLLDRALPPGKAA